MRVTVTVQGQRYENLYFFYITPRFFGGHLSDTSVAQLGYLCFSKYTGWNVRNHVMKPPLDPMEHHFCSYRDMTAVMGALIPSMEQEMIVPITAFRTHEAHLSSHETLYISDANSLQKNVSGFFQQGAFCFHYNPLLCFQFFSITISWLNLIPLCFR